MRRDLEKIVFHPSAAPPLYYQDLALISFTWYMARLRELDISTNEINHAALNSFSLRSRCSYVMVNSPALCTLYDYFTIESEFDFGKLRKEYNWYSKATSSESTLQSLDRAMNTAAMLWCVYFSKTYWLMKHYHHARTNNNLKPLADEPDWAEWLNLKHSQDNPFKEGIKSLVMAQPMGSFLYAFVSMVPIGQRVLEIHQEAHEGNRLIDWLRPMINFGSMEVLKLYHLNPIPNGDWVNFS